MPEKDTVERAREDAQEGKSPSTQGGEFVREEMHHVREGKHGARSPQQAIAIGLSKARRAGVKRRAPKRGRASARTRKQAKRDLRRAKAIPAAVHQKCVLARFAVRYAEKGKVRLPADRCHARRMVAPAAAVLQPAIRLP